jgi:formiminoglutamase
MSWLEIHRGEAPLVVSFPHTGTEIPSDIEARFVSPWLARKDADWWVDILYGFARDLGATTIRTAISRSVIDVNRDPSGASLYPGQATTELCPTVSFDGEALYAVGDEPDTAEINRRRAVWFTPYHVAIEDELTRLKARHGKVVLYDAHSIRSAVPRLFEGELPHFNIGTNRGVTCHPALTAAVEAACGPDFSRVTNGRFVGGWTTRQYGRPETGFHALQMELACRGYLDEPAETSEATWPVAYDPARAAPLQARLHAILSACLSFALTCALKSAKDPS